MNQIVKREGKGRKILVLGDWVVDDYWVTGIHRSPTASRTGRAHYRSLHTLNGSVRALCGAGRTASVLHEAVLPEGEQFEIVAIGVWHQEDDSAIAQLVGSNVPPGLNPLRLTTPELSAAPCKVVNLASQINSFLSGSHRHLLPHEGDYDGVGTTRMIRIFQNTGTRVELLERVDWDLPAPFSQREGAHAWFPDPNAYLNDSPHREGASALFDSLPDLDTSDIEAVVIKDLGKGCVSSATVRWLSESVDREVPWFVSSKSWRPAWLGEVPIKSLRLLMVPQVAARTAIDKRVVRRWLADSGVPTSDAIRCIEEFFGEHRIERDRTFLALLPDRQKALFLGPFEDAEDCHIQRLAEPVDLDFEVAMASVLLPALVAHMLHTSETRLTHAQVRAAASFTDNWMKQEVQRIEASEDTNPPKRLGLILHREYPQFGEWHSVRWSVERTRWDRAFKDMGIIDENGSVPMIQLTRAMTVLDGYVCLVAHKQEIVQRLLREVRRFVAARQRRHVSFLLAASPGSGKSALIDALVGSQKLSSYTINVAQLPGRVGVIDELDTVATLQAQNRTRPLLVFVDEINTKLESQFVYDLFLSPMQNGEYVRGGNRFRLDPCMWIFAGTTKPTAGDKDASDKARDFESRLTVAPMFLDLPEHSITTTERETGDSELRVERIYLGVAILTAHFPDVRWVSEKVLGLFHSLPIGCTLRDLVKLISGFDNVQLGKVHSENVPKACFSQIEGIAGFDFSNWKQREEGRFVKIVAR